jgi:hypothetical protein
MLLADEATNTGLGAGLGALVGILAGYATSLIRDYWKRTDTNRDKDTADESQKQKDIINSWKEMYKRQDDRVKILEDKVEQSRTEEVKCARRLERAEANIQFMYQWVEERTGVKFKPYRLDQGSTEHLALPPEASGEPRPDQRQEQKPFPGQEKRKKPFKYNTGDQGDDKPTTDS